MKILIAEDDPVASKVLQRALESSGYEVIVTCNGLEAWEAFDHEPVRLIVSDWLMPSLDGLGFCEKVRNRKKTLYTYFILLTSQETKPENYDLAAEAGVDDFLYETARPSDHSNAPSRRRADLAFHHRNPPAQRHDSDLYLLPENTKRR